MLADDIAISVKNLTKTYRIFSHPGDRIKQFFNLGLRQYHREFTALDDVSFDIRKGETVGIIGRNGSGKSTLLQLICDILKPTSGAVQTHGRVSALLELGAGFNPEFTGRENVYFQGALMGCTKEHMDERFDDIAAFAEIGEFIDQPVRTYSSGMFVRLAFAVAISVDPDILIVDEALAVGDMAFQRKCFERLRQLLSNEQCVVLFVSHDLRQVERFCSRVIYFQNGQVVADGRALDVCQKYYDQMNGSTKDAAAKNWEAHAKIKSPGKVELQGVTINDIHGNEIREIASGDPLHVKVRFKLPVPLRQPEFIIGTQTADLAYLSSSSTAERDAPLCLEPGEHTVEYLLDQFPLAPGQYFVRFGIRDEHSQLIFAGEGLCPFQVIPDSCEFRRPARLLNLKTDWVVGGVTLPAGFSSAYRQ